VVNPLPLDQAATDSDILIGIDVNGDPSDLLNKTDHRLLDVWFGSAQIMMHSLTAHMMSAYPPDIYVRPHLNSFGALEFWRVREIIAHVEKDKDNFKRQLARKIDLYMAESAGVTRAGYAGRRPGAGPLSRSAAAHASVFHGVPRSPPCGGGSWG